MSKDLQKSQICNYFFFNDTAPTELYTLSLHDALPISAVEALTPKFDGSPDARFEVQRILVDGDLAMVHVKATRPSTPPTAVADIYRFSAGCIVEHWDVLQSVPPNPVHDHPMF